MCRIGCKAVGMAAFTFCLGMICGLLFPIYVVAVVETLMLLLIAYMCLFRF